VIKEHKDMNAKPATGPDETVSSQPLRQQYASLSSVDKRQFRGKITWQKGKN
jgi:hypothetical protein